MNPHPHSTGSPPVDEHLLIGGEWVAGDARIEIRNPAHPAELVGTVVRGGPAEAAAAIEAAQAARPAWTALGYRERAHRLSRALDALQTGIDERAVLFTRENGKVLAEARADLVGVITRQRLTLELVDQLEQDRILSGPAGRTIVARRPFGVVVSIVPWNGPIGLAFVQVLPALLAGNTVVVKPPETCPLALIATLRILADHLPPGTVNIVTGYPEDVGETLTTHRAVAKIGFTGSIAAARGIMANAAQSIKGLALELGGNDPAILLDDVTLDEATLQRLVFSCFRLSGQVCMAAKRIYVARARYDEFISAFADAVDRIVVGDGLLETVTMGPMHSARGLDRAQQLVADAERRGGTVQRLGTIENAATFHDGHFMSPTVVLGLSDDAPLVTEEQFCPAVPIRAFDDVEEALAAANDTIYGLGGSAWGADVERAIGVAQRIDAGTVWINTHGTHAIDRRAPYGGVKQSGMGRRAGIEGVDEYVQTQTLTAVE
jgi:acyl-CoA reductase-like NAD-dependent aldehyde dehydrogenase